MNRWRSGEIGRGVVWVEGEEPMDESSFIGPESQLQTTPPVHLGEATRAAASFKKITEANSGGLVIRMRWAARVAQFYRSATEYGD